MAKKGSVTMDISRMHDLIEGLKRRASIQVGVFADKSTRGDGPLTNASLAAIHEYGSVEHNLPPRSMLRIPIQEHIKEIMDPFKGKAIQMLKAGSLLQMYRKIGVAAEKVVLGAFDTGGYGKWPDLTYKTLLRKLKGSLKVRKSKIGRIYAGQVGQAILIQTGQLRRSFSSRVKLIN